MKVFLPAATATTAAVKRPMVLSGSRQHIKAHPNTRGGSPASQMHGSASPDSHATPPGSPACLRVAATAPTLCPLPPNPPLARIQMAHFPSHHTRPLRRTLPRKSKKGIQIHTVERESNSTHIEEQRTSERGRAGEGGGGGGQEKQRPPQQKHVHCTVRVSEKRSKAQRARQQVHVNCTTARPHDQPKSRCGRLDQMRRRCKQQGKMAAQLTFKNE